jgi:hypothetical protein
MFPDWFSLLVRIAFDLHSDTDDNKSWILFELSFDVLFSYIQLFSSVHTRSGKKMALMKMVGTTFKIYLQVILLLICFKDEFLLIVQSFLIDERSFSSYLSVTHSVPEQKTLSSESAVELWSAWLQVSSGGKHRETRGKHFSNNDNLFSRDCTSKWYPWILAISRPLIKNSWK